jgi:UPF0755 protein
VKKWIFGMAAVGGLLSVCAAAAAIYLASDLSAFARQPIAHGRSNDSGAWETTVVLPPGQNFSDILKGLVDARVVADPRRFKLLARLLGYDRRIRAGEYLFTSAMSPIEILDKLARGKVVLRALTIPEGFNLREIAALLDREGMGVPERFLSKVTDPEFAAARGIPGKSLEGYLFPDTYYFPRNTAVEQIIQALLDRFEAVYTPEWTDRTRLMGLTRHEVVTLASMVEKETGVPEERRLIASVFHNRLKKGMRLQSDPTVIYGIENFDGNVTREHLNTPTAYNTYQLGGLPAGPIASPGRASLSAVLFPEETDFLYFVARGDGTHQFSKSLTEHNQAVRRYQLGGKDHKENKQ